jgi:hypothetical protein
MWNMFWAVLLGEEKNFKIDACRENIFGKNTKTF